MTKLFSALALTIALTACGGGSKKSGDDSGSGDPSKPVNRVNWDSIPKEFNPDIDVVDFQTDGIDKIYVDAFGFNEDVAVVYSDEIAPGSGLLRVFRVSKGASSPGGVSARQSGNKLNLQSSGTYECSIRVTNGQIAELKGGCYIRLQIVLPPGTEIEVYNVGKLISKRFFAVSTETFLKEFDRATWAEDKFKVIETFLASYQGLTNKPSLNTKQMSEVLGDFIRKDEKFRALRLLQAAISDRENLPKMIDDEFSHFEREEARAICGI